MKSLFSLLFAVTPILCIVLIINQMAALFGTTFDDDFRLDLDSLKESVRLAEKAAAIKFEQNKPNDSLKSGSPFTSTQPVSIPVVTHHPAEPATPLNREILVVQGILKGSKPMAVLADKSGNTHIVKVGEIVFDRKVTAINSNGVTLIDAGGSETLAIP